MLESLIGLGIGGLLFFILLWLLPFFIIARSGKTSGTEKLIWLLLMLFFSWFSWILYLILAPVGEKNT